eukprot:g20671.t1
MLTQGIDDWHRSSALAHGTARAEEAIDMAVAKSLHRSGRFYGLTLLKDAVSPKMVTLACKIADTAGFCCRRRRHRARLQKSRSF